MFPISIINTPGYARQRATLVEGSPILQQPLVFGSGVVFAQPQSVRDNILELRLHEETQQQGQFEAEVQQLQQAQSSFQGTNDLGSRLTNFFNSLNNLASNPSNLALRQGVLTAAGNLAFSFRGASRNPQLQRSTIDQSVTRSVSQINALTQQVAAYNQKLSERRVERTKQFLVEHGVPAGDIETEALGDQHNLTAEEVKGSVEQDTGLTPGERKRVMRNMRTIILASNRRVDVSLNTTGQTSVRQFPFNAADSLSLIGGREKPAKKVMRPTAKKPMKKAMKKKK